MPASPFAALLAQVAQFASGKRTYTFIAAAAAVTLAKHLPGLSPDLRAQLADGAGSAVVSVLLALAAYFRSRAGK